MAKKPQRYLVAVMVMLDLDNIEAASPSDAVLQFVAKLPVDRRRNLYCKRITADDWTPYFIRERNGKTIASPCMSDADAKLRGQLRRSIAVNRALDREKAKYNRMAKRKGWPLWGEPETEPEAKS